MSSAMMNATEQSSSFSSPSSGGNSAERPSKKQSPSSAAVKVSKMQASFAERTATEMEEILSWYKKYEGAERLKVENQQIQSMPHNAMIVIDDDVDGEGNDNNTSQSESGESDQSSSEQQEIQISNDEYVTVKDYHTPTQKFRTSAGPKSSRKKDGLLLASAVRSLTKAQKTDEPPPIAIQVSSEDDDDVSAMTSISPKYNVNNSMKNAESPTSILSVHLIHENPNQKEITGYRDEEEKVLAMLSPTKPDELAAQTLIKKTDDYVDEEEEVLGMLLSPSSCSSKSVLSVIGARKSPVGRGDDSVSGMSTGEEAQSQIKAADELIRNTQNMAEIILQLQKTPLLSGDESDHDNDDDDDINIYDNNLNNSDDSSLSPSYSESLSSIQYSLDARSLKELCDQDASIASLKVLDPPGATSGFQDRLFYRAIVPIFLSVVIGLVLKSINA